MSKRAERAALKALPDYSPDGKTKVDLTLDRLLYQHGYERAEKDIIEHCEKRIAEYNADNLSNMFLRRAFENVIRFIKEIPYNDYNDDEI